MKLLLQEMSPTVQDYGLMHIIHHADSRRPRPRRRSFENQNECVANFFDYSDTMKSCGYSIKSNIAKPWFYEVCCGARVIESVQLEWPTSNQPRKIQD